MVPHHEGRVVQVIFFGGDAPGKSACLRAANSDRVGWRMICWYSRAGEASSGGVPGSNIGDTDSHDTGVGMGRPATTESRYFEYGVRESSIPGDGALGRPLTVRVGSMGNPRTGGFSSCFARLKEGEFWSS